MADITSTSKIELRINLVLTELEARALSKMTDYGFDSFIKGYYKQLGRTNLEPYVDGLRSLFKSIDSQLPQHLRKMDEVRAIFNEDNRIDMVRQVTK